jgi:protein SCO1/2
MVKIQDWLGDRLGRDAYILALTVDPATDTVDRLRAYAGQLGARPGWFFLGGTPANVLFALKKLGQRTETPEGHTNILIVGNETTGLWKKAFGLADSEALIAVVDSVLNDTGDTHR